MTAATDALLVEAVETDRAPTYDLGAERTLIGILMTNPAKVAEVVDLDPNLFYKPQHAEIFAAILKLHAEGKPTAPIAVTGYLADEGSLVRLGGAAYLAECYELVPVADMLGHYVERLLVTAERRNAQAVGIRIADAATTPGRTFDDIAAMAQQLIVQARTRKRALEMHQLGSLINPCLDDIEVRKHKPKGIKTGFHDLDKVLGGMAPKQLITVAAPTGAGKSVFLTDVARAVAIHGRLTVALFSFEMSKEEIFDRLIAAEAGVSHSAVRDGDLSEADWMKVTGRIGPMSNAPMFLTDDAPMTVADIRFRCERLRQSHDLDLVIVDHMHLVAPSQKVRDESAHITDVSRGLKLDLAMALGVPVLAAAQLNRNSALRADKRPQLTDLKHSSSIEQDSNVVLMLHREEYHDAATPRKGEADVIVAKNRSGRQGDVVVLAAQLDRSRFVSMAASS